MKMYLMIYTPYGDRYKVDLMTGDFVSVWALGRSEVNYSADGRWKFKAFSHVKKNDWITLERIQKNPSVVDIIKWRWKNGNPQWTVSDVDCGTHRKWGSTKFHGVCDVRIVKEN